MTYATKQDLIDRFGQAELLQLTDRTHRPQTTIDDVVVDRALTDATALADGYLAKVHRLPLSVVPPVLIKVCADIARYFLHGKAAEKDSPVARAYAEAVAWLKDVSRGIVSLEAEGVTPAVVFGGSVKANASTRIFTRRTLRDA